MEEVARYSTEHEKSIPETDLSDAQWSYIEPHLPTLEASGRPRVHTLREIVDAIFYILRSGCAWRLLPHDFPPWKTVHHYFGTWRIDGTRERMHSALRRRVRVRPKRNSQPSAAIVDSQSIKTTGVGGKEHGYDGAKKIKGRKRHLLVDTQGLVLEALGFMVRKSRTLRGHPALAGCRRA